ncbi:polyprenyl synthetase family protein [Streptomyces sp. NPDC002677]|uniref:polyprenyl synthetase family protein n=1 Tax=Streptomyces sp. NPDC002677 TaxID=3154774 RepID=UPI00331A69A8
MASQPIAVPRAGSAGQILTGAARAVDPALRQAARHLAPPMRRLTDYHLGWADAEGRPAAVPGKALRPALVLLACRAVGGPMAQALPAAVAAELVHNASLLHDDVIDDDQLRRHRPTIEALFGTPAAILAGDALFFLAVQTMAQAPPPLCGTGLQWLTAAVQELIDGEYADTTLEQRPDPVSPSEAAVMSAAKTGSLIAVSCALGALAGGADAQRTAHLRDFGTHLGQCFQLADDILGIWGDPAVTGKPRLADLQARKKSLPVTAALSADNEPARELGALYATFRPLGSDELERAAHLVEAAGGRDWAVGQSRDHLGQALEHLRAADPDAAAEADLTCLARLAADRTH